MRLVILLVFGFIFLIIMVYELIFSPVFDGIILVISIIGLYISIIESVYTYYNEEEYGKRQQDIMDK